MKNLFRALAAALIAAVIMPGVLGAQSGYSTPDTDKFVRHGYSVVKRGDGLAEIRTVHGRVALVPQAHPLAARGNGGGSVGSLPLTSPTTADTPDTLTVTWTSRGANNEFAVPVPITVVVNRRAMEDTDTFRNRFTQTVRETLEHWPQAIR